MQSATIRGATSGRRRSPTPSWVLGLVIALALTLAACSSTTTHSGPTATPHLASGQTGIFVSVADASKVGTPTQTPSGKLVTLHAGDASPVWSVPTHDIATPLLFDNGTLFAGLERVTSGSGSPPTSAVEAVRASDGAQLWLVDQGTSFLTPIAADASAVYVVDLDLSGQQSELRALRIADGQDIWSDPLPVSPAGAIGGLGIGAPSIGVLAEGTIYLCCALGTLPSGMPQSTMSAIRTSDGKQLWSVSLSGEFSSPVVSNGTMYMSGLTIDTSTGPGGPRPETPTVVAVRTSDGSQLWSHPLAANANLEGLSPLAVTDTAVCIAITVQSAATPGPGAPPLTSSLIALNPTTGAQVWSVPATGIANSLLADNGTLYLSGLDLTSTPGGPGGPPQTGTLAAYQSSDGKQLWSQPQSHGVARIIGTESGSLVALGVTQNPSQPQTVTGYVETLAATDGSSQWKYTITGGGPVAAAVGAE